MALTAEHNQTIFGVGDKVRVIQSIKEEDKTRESVFEGIVIAIKGRGQGKTFTVRRIGEAQIGIEKIFPLNLPTIEKITVVKKGLRGVRRSKLYFIREKSATEIEMIYRKAAAKERTKQLNSKASKKLVKKSGKK